MFFCKTQQTDLFPPGVPTDFVESGFCLVQTAKLNAVNTLRRPRNLRPGTFSSPTGREFFWLLGSPVWKMWDCA